MPINFLPIDTLDFSPEVLNAVEVWPVRGIKDLSHVEPSISLLHLASNDVGLVSWQIVPEDHDFLMDVESALEVCLHVKEKLLDFFSIDACLVCVLEPEMNQANICTDGSDCSYWRS